MRRTVSKSGLAAAQASSGRGHQPPAEDIQRRRAWTCLDWPWLWRALLAFGRPQNLIGGLFDRDGLRSMNVNPHAGSAAPARKRWDDARGGLVVVEAAFRSLSCSQPSARLPEKRDPPPFAYRRSASTRRVAGQSPGGDPSDLSKACQRARPICLHHTAVGNGWPLMQLAGPTATSNNTHARRTPAKILEQVGATQGKERRFALRTRPLPRPSNSQRLLSHGSN